MAYEKELEIALAAVRVASRLCEEVRANLVKEDTLAKKDKSPVTVADFGAQALVLRHLADVFPEDLVVAEEEASVLRESANATLRAQVVEAVKAVEPVMDEEGVLEAIDRGQYPGGAEGRFWTLDPIDGTKGFLRGEQYAVALALIENGEVVLGVLGCPNLQVDHEDPASERGCLFYAVRGGGAYALALLPGAEERTIRMRELQKAAQGRFCESVESGHTRHDASAQIAERLGVVNAPARMDSQCKYAALARGEADIYLRLPTRPGYVERIWDHAAGWIVVTEAGGRVGDVTGRALDFAQGRGLEQNRGVVAASAGIFDEVIAAVREVLAI